MYQISSNSSSDRACHKRGGKEGSTRQKLSRLLTSSNRLSRCLPNLWFMITILKMCNFSEQSMYKCPIFQLLPTLLLGCLCCFILLCILFEQLLLLLSLPLLTTKTTLFDTVPPSLCLVAIATNNQKVHYVRLIQLFLKYHHC